MNREVDLLQKIKTYSLHVNSAKIGMIKNWPEIDNKCAYQNNTQQNIVLKSSIL